MTVRQPISEIDVDMLRHRLFADPAIVRKIRTEFGIDRPLSGAALEQEIVAVLDQNERDPATYRPTVFDVFRAAVRAIASSSRKWTAYCANEPRLQDLLYGFDPIAVARRDRGMLVRQIQTLLPGLTSGRDSNAIFDWATRISEYPGEYELLLWLRKRALAAAAAATGHLSLSDPEVTAIVATALAKPSHHLADICGRAFKTPGMGPTLASEYLRNLGWTGFKPDRHVIRLLTAWFGISAEARNRAKTLAGLLDLTGADVVNFLAFSVVGAQKTPIGESVMRVDQLVWLYGAFVETKKAGVKLACVRTIL